MRTKLVFLLLFLINISSSLQNFIYSVYYLAKYTTIFSWLMCSTPIIAQKPDKSYSVKILKLEQNVYEGKNILLECCIKWQINVSIAQIESICALLMLALYFMLWSKMVPYLHLSSPSVLLWMLGGGAKIWRNLSNGENGESVTLFMMVSPLFKSYARNLAVLLVAESWYYSMLHTDMGDQRESVGIDQYNRLYCTTHSFQFCVGKWQEHLEREIVNCVLNNELCSFVMQQ